MLIVDVIKFLASGFPFFCICLFIGRTMMAAVKIIYQILQIKEGHKEIKKLRGNTVK